MTGDGSDERELALPGGRRLGYREFGDRQGRPLLYCHGMPGSRLEPAVFADAAARRGLRVISFDRPGYGRTSALGARRAGDEVADVRALVNELGLATFHVLGFSGGGPHALAIAAWLPDRVEHLTLVSSWAPFEAVGLDGMNDDFRGLWELAAADFPAFRETLRGALENAGDAFTLLHAGAPPTDRAILSLDTVAGPYRENLRAATQAGLDGMFEDAGASVREWTFAVDALRCPANVWHGAHDGNAPAAMGRWLAERLPEARHVEWPKAAHFEWFHRPDDVLEPHAAP